ncbi:hypothetical protein NE237_012122 [Protea cynaroides]|uniref:Neprosin PEP catalytic domain-containing protein n=1 Tax=Protea cynaroides TaxID=273540 RepID=A0A9Q0JWI6_9MAGN|nr:hypothetical protein NE237_012122 [Protea cynaroides]
MGSGHFPSEGDGKACLVSEIQIITKIGGSFVDFGTVTPFQSAPQCYKILEECDIIACVCDWYGSDRPKSESIDCDGGADGICGSCESGSGDSKDLGSEHTLSHAGVFFTKIKASTIVTGRNDDCRWKCSHLQGAQGVVDIGGGNPIAEDAGLTAAKDGFQNDALHNSVLDARDDSMQMISGTLMVVGGLRALEPRDSIEMDVSMKGSPILKDAKTRAGIPAVAKLGC